jgi:AcrR family transcriptional regulator
VSPRSRRDDVLETATDLFYREGIRSIGVDTIVERAGVSKMTLYNHFASKDDLAVAYLRRRDEGVRRFVEARLVELAPDPRDRPTAVFAVFAEQIERDDFRGCHLINTLAEFPTGDQRARTFALGRNSAWRDFLIELVAGAGLPRAETLGDQLFLLLEGAFVTAAMERTVEPMFCAQRAAVALMSLDLEADGRSETGKES